MSLFPKKVECSFKLVCMAAQFDNLNKYLKNIVSFIYQYDYKIMIFIKFKY